MERDNDRCQVTDRTLTTSLTDSQIRWLIRHGHYDEWQERAAIIEYDAKRSRQTAEQIAYERIVDRAKKKGELD
jgi:hypothetical protein